MSLAENLRNKLKSGKIKAEYVLISGLLVIVAFFFLVPAAVPRPVPDLPPISEPEERWAWIEQYSTRVRDYSKLTDWEMQKLINKDAFSKATLSLPMEAYFDYATRLSKEPLAFDKSILDYFKGASERGCKSASFVPQCYTAAELIEYSRHSSLLKSAALGYLLAEIKVLNEIYTKNGCCNYSVLDSLDGLLYDIERKKIKLSQHNKDYLSLLKALHEVSQNSVTKETVEGLEAVATKYSYAAFELFRIYHDGKGVTKNQATAYAWLLIAKKQGNPIASEILPEYEGTLSNEFLLEGQKQAEKLDNSKRK